MPWSQLFIALAAGVFVWFFPGLLIGFALRLRGLNLLAMAPVLSFSLVSCSALVAPFFDLSWNIPLVLALSVIVSLLIAIIRLILWRRWTDPLCAPWSLRNFFLPISVALISFVMIVANYIRVFRVPDAISQTFDAVFHYNAIRYILDTANASVFHIGGLNGETFYPSGWHAAVSLITMLIPESIPLSVNAGTILLVGLVFPLGVIFMARTIFGDRKSAVICVAGITAVGSGFFPFIASSYGVLLPYLMSVCLIPAVLGLLTIIFGKAQQPLMSKCTAFVLLVLASPGIILAHPSALPSCILLSAPLWLGFYCSKIKVSLKSEERFPVVFWTAAFTTVLVLATVFWTVLRPSLDTAKWSGIATIPQALGELFTYSPRTSAISIVLAALFLIGFVGLIRRRSEFSWLLAVWAVSALLYTAGVAFPTSDVRTFLVGTYYNDSYRPAFLLAVTTIPIVAYGGHIVWESIVKALDSAANKPRTDYSKSTRFTLLMEDGWKALNSTLGLLLTGAALTLLFTGTTQLGSAVWGGLGNVPWGRLYAAKSYGLTPESPLITPDELALIKRLEEEVPEDAVLANNPWNGSALAYAFSNRKVILPHMLYTSTYLTPDEKLILEKLNNYQTEPQVCLAVQRLKAYYVLDFGTRQVNNEKRDKTPPGIKNIADNPAFELIDSEGEAAKLYKFIGCG